MEKGRNCFPKAWRGMAMSFPTSLLASEIPRTLASGRGQVQGNWWLLALPECPGALASQKLPPKMLHQEILLLSSLCL